MKEALEAGVLHFALGAFALFPTFVGRQVTSQ